MDEQKPGVGDVVEVDTTLINRETLMHEIVPVRGTVASVVEGGFVFQFNMNGLWFRKAIAYVGPTEWRIIATKEQLDELVAEESGGGIASLNEQGGCP